MQPIYYPGFAIGGLAEPLGLVAIRILLVPTPAASIAFWLIAGAFVALLAMHAAYWLFTHPVNRFWVKDTELSRAGSGVFSIGGNESAPHAGRGEWRSLRDRWEYSHVVRAALGLAGLVSLTAAIAA